MSISFNDVVSVTGLPGLYQVIKNNDNSIVVESLDDKKKRQLIRGNMMVSKLTDVSIYTEDDSEPLLSVLQEIQKKFGKELPVSKKSSKDELMGFLTGVLPTLDSERVYPSNVKKLIGWYKILSSFDIELKISKEEEEKNKEEAKKAAIKEKEAKQKK
ncbi:MAG: DUF5606 domain-containing protein [Bacteroidia bacterium]|nr:DUF5606 domain-containing protein [Bacteroidia bacterium]